MPDIENHMVLPYADDEPESRPRDDYEPTDDDRTQAIHDRLIFDANNAIAKNAQVIAQLNNVPYFDLHDLKVALIESNNILRDMRDEICPGLGQRQGN